MTARFFAFYSLFCGKAFRISADFDLFCKFSNLKNTNKNQCGCIITFRMVQHLVQQ